MQREELSRRPVATAKVLGGRLCLDFVNTVGGRDPNHSRRKSEPRGVEIREERLNEYDDLLAWGLRLGVLDEAGALSLRREARRRESESKAVLARALALREAIYRICQAIIAGKEPRDEDVEVLNRELEIASGHERLAADGGRFVWRWVERRGDLDRVLWQVAASAAELLTTGDLERLRECGGVSCGWLFEDTSRNRSRQWCNMQDCGNLAKVRRFRSKLSSGKRKAQNRER